MIFSIRNLSFDLGPVLLEGYSALAARFVCALLLLAAGFAARWLMLSRIFPSLHKHTWHFSGTPILLKSFARPVQQLAVLTGIYLAIASLPWSIAAITKVLWVAYQIGLTYCLCRGLYAASDLTTLLLASCGEEVRSNKTLKALLNKVYKFLILILGAMTIAQETGLPVGSFVASAGLVGLTVSLAAQDTAKNLFSGVVILLDKPFSIGDWIRVGDVEGEVVDINFRSTKIRAVDNSLYILTNSNVSAATINNATQRDRRLYRFTLGVTYDTTRAQLETLMTDITAMLTSNPDIYADSAFVRLTGFGDSSINMMVSAYVRTADVNRFLKIQNDLNLDLMDVMKKDR